MDFPVLIEPLAGGSYRASTGEPLNLSAEAETADAAIALLRRRWRGLSDRGARIEMLNGPPPANP